MSDRAALVGRYKELRLAFKSFVQKLLSHVDREELDEAARALGLLDGRPLILHNEEEIELLMDFTAHDVLRHGESRIQRFLKEGPDLTADEALVGQSLADDRMSLFKVKETEPGVGAVVLDLVLGRTFFVYDINFSNSVDPGNCLVFRILEVDGIYITSGTSLPIVPHAIYNLVAALEDWCLDALLSSSPEVRSDANAAILRILLSKGASERIAFAPPGSISRPADRLSELPDYDDEYAVTAPIHRDGPRVGRNEPCPCGSGRKFKKCCGH
jgi:hypothetical protein